MQLRIYPYGDRKDNYISLYCHLMRGENDDHLKWPFKGTITITLLNQLKDNGHLTKTLHLGNSAEHRDTVKNPESDTIRSTYGWGYSHY